MVVSVAGAVVPVQLSAGSVVVSGSVVVAIHESSAKHPFLQAELQSST